MKTSELIGPALDWAVAKCEGFKECMVFGRGSVKDSGFAVPNTHGGYKPVLLKCVHDKWYKRCDGYPWGRDQVIWQPSTDWSQGGPIIEREEITIAPWYCDGKFSHWEANGHDLEYDEVGEYFHGSDYAQTGPTPLIAAMRCYVASKLGDEVELPPELLR